HRDCEIIAVDNSPAMVERATALLATEAGLIPVTQRCEDVRTTVLENASVVVLNFTLQFVPLENRDALIQRIADALSSGDILVLSEKIRFPYDEEDAMQLALKHSSKRNN